MMVLLLTPLRILLTVSPIFILLSSVEEVDRVSQEELLSKLSARLSADQSEVCGVHCQLMNVFLLLRGWLIVRLREMMVSRWSFM